jgi:hypothetical protein
VPPFPFGPLFPLSGMRHLHRVVPAVYAAARNLSAHASCLHLLWWTLTARSLVHRTPLPLNVRSAPHRDGHEARRFRFSPCMRRASAQNSISPGHSMNRPRSPIRTARKTAGSASAAYTPPRSINGPRSTVTSSPSSNSNSNAVGSLAATRVIRCNSISSPHSSGAMRSGTRPARHRLQSSINSCWCNAAHSTTIDRTRAGPLPAMTAIGAIPMTNSYSP